ncbi:MAG: hypothetical protein N2111_07000 [Candidatus Sumerlaeaceae bacterium]|nr:hypothetical protein [Candidatus Sumerlaeaceae bacterium]
MEKSTTRSDLRALVREEVLRALQRAEAQLSPQRPGPPAAAQTGGHMLTVLFTGRLAPSADFLAQMADLGQRGYALGCAFSNSFKQFLSPDEILRSLPAAATHLASDSEREWQSWLAASSALILPLVSLNTAAKSAAGIEDSMPTFILLSHLRAAKPVISCPDMSQIAVRIREQFAGAAPAMAHTAERNFHALQQMGVQFVPVLDVAAAVGRAFHVEPNETPQRLAKTRPFPKREFITAEDVHSAMKAGLKTLTHSRDAIVTAEARDQAARLGVILEAI